MILISKLLLCGIRIREKESGVGVVDDHSHGELGEKGTTRPLWSQHEIKP